MITLFRRIREKLIGDGDLYKYLLYAIGEIALVMIGILLALQVNNWNEERKQEEEAIRVLSDYANTIESVISGAEYHLMPAIQLDSVHHHILNKTLEPDFLVNSLMVDPKKLIIDPMHTLDFSGWYYNENINTILQNERQFPERFSGILLRVRRTSSAFQTMRSLSEQLKTMQLENQHYLKTKDWMYKTDPESFKQRIDFFHTDTQFRNHLRSYQDVNAFFLQQQEVFFKHQMFTWMEYQLLIEQKSMGEIFEQIESFGYKRAVEMACSEEIVLEKDDTFASFYSWYPVYNNTSEPVEIYHLNPITHETYVIDTVDPGKYTRSATSRDFPYLQIGTNNTCERQYAVRWDKSVVIDP